MTNYGAEVGGGRSEEVRAIVPYLRRARPAKGKTRKVLG